MDGQKAFYVHCAEEADRVRMDRIRQALAPFICADVHPGAPRVAEANVRSRVIEACQADRKFLEKVDALYWQWEKGACLRLIAKRERPLIDKFARQVGRETFGHQRFGSKSMDKFRKLFRWVSVTRAKGGV